MTNLTVICYSGKRECNPSQWGAWPTQTNCAANIAPQVFLNFVDYLEKQTNEQTTTLENFVLN